MARSATTADVFNAVGDARRREILDYLVPGERAVGDLVDSLGLTQPAASKHLRVLREVGLVSVRKDGRNRMYRLNGHAMKAVHDWTKTFERFWQHHLGRIKQHAEDAHENNKDNNPKTKGN